jgi:hypothetical protein
MFKSLKSKAELDEYFKREYEHGEYCHYTHLETLNSILENKEIWLGNVGKFNDRLDARQFLPSDYADNTDEKILEKYTRPFYSLCFSTGINENLSLWYLYAGMNGKGSYLQWTKALIKHLVEESTYILTETDENDGKRRKKDGGKSITLVNGLTMKRSFKDVLYYKSSNNSRTVNLKYNTMTNNNIPVEDFAQYRAENVGFCKGLIWYYEKETRLLVELTGDALDYVQKNPSKTFVVVIKIADNIYKKLKIKVGPEITSLDNVVKEYPAIKQFVLDTSNADLSTYSGTVKMNLCEKCSKK